MQLNDIGKIAHQFLAEIPTHFLFVHLDEFVVMPNHVHAIIGICKSPVETLHATSLPQQRKQNYHGKNTQFSKQSPQKYSLSSVVRSFKSAVTIHAKKTNPHFAWQPRFYDRIIRNDDELAKIRNYVHKNPERWHFDRNNDGGIWM